MRIAVAVFASTPYTWIWSALCTRASTLAAQAADPFGNRVATVLYNGEAVGKGRLQVSESNWLGIAL